MIRDQLLRLPVIPFALVVIVVSLVPLALFATVEYLVLKGLA